MKNEEDGFKIINILFFWVENEMSSFESFEVRYYIFLLYLQI